MVEISPRQPQTSLVRDAGDDKAPSAHRADGEDQNSFLYANCALGLFPIDPVDLHDFAKGQLLALAIFVPVAMALFIFLAS
ncbi:hypothetical protein N2603_24865 [Bradyrhizobium huanghuaihaiense]|uniref:hypothetical protein n=1 Tax=Bradyrhizobium huanghuaihaiense TaxID=990078 RepID=UPI0021A9ABCE|nr:hypothetical protein [Bradyrhizobium sp. CB3035]UWU73327.1 hypothetical protein N2603_24865 [Bradyrhizobium sp. CB3035]